MNRAGRAQSGEPLFRLVKRAQMTSRKANLMRLLAVFGGFAFILLLSIAVMRRSPADVVASMLKGAFGTERNIMALLRDAALLLIISLAVTPAFKMRFWNIGAEGQTLFSAFACVACMRELGGKIPDGPLIAVMFAASVLGGILWSVIPAIFKALWNTNETLFTLMMNYVAAQTVLYFIKVWAPMGSGILQPIEHGNIPHIGGEDYWLSIIVATFFTAIMFVYLKYHKHGYEISVVGESEKTAKYIGIDVDKVIIRTLVFSGILCGVAGFLIGGGINHMVSEDSVGGKGFTAVLVSWLSRFNPIAMAGCSLLVAFLTRGTAKVMESAGITNNFFAQVVIGLIFLIIISAEFFIEYKVVFPKKGDLAKSHRNRRAAAESLGAPSAGAGAAPTESGGAESDSDADSADAGREGSGASEG